MQFNTGDNTLYMSAITNMLRDFQERDQKPTWKGFLDAVRALGLSSGQKGPLELRLKILESSIRSEQDTFQTFEQVIESSSLVVIDLTDPLLTGHDVNGIFGLLLDTYKATRLNGKMVVLDEAHKYLKADGDDPLSMSILEGARQMRHEGARFVISSQSPMSIPGELIDLSSLTILHYFESHKWFDTIKSHKPLNEDDFDLINQLPTGAALVHTREWPFSWSGFQTMHVRKRLTVDAGATRIAQ